MGRASSSKKVARAARTTGKPGASRNWIWPAALVVVVGLGVGLIFASRGGEASASPKLGEHWHAAYGVYTCDEFQPAMVDGEDGDLNGIHTHGDGLIHMHPFSTLVTGDGSVMYLGVGLRSSAEAEAAVDSDRGMRHRSAQRFSYDHPSTTIAVVSDNGPVTIFRQGRAIGLAGGV